MDQFYPLENHNLLEEGPYSVLGLYFSLTASQLNYTCISPMSPTKLKLWLKPSLHLLMNVFQQFSRWLHVCRSLAVCSLQSETFSQENYHGTLLACLFRTPALLIKTHSVCSLRMSTLLAKACILYCLLQTLTFIAKARMLHCRGMPVALPLDELL